MKFLIKRISGLAAISMGLTITLANLLSDEYTAAEGLSITLATAMAVALLLSTVAFALDVIFPHWRE